MRKLMLLSAAVMLVAGCSSVQTNNGRRSATWQDPGQIHLIPLEAEIKVDRPISGVAECEKWFWFWTKRPVKQTYGAGLSVPDGNVAPDDCTRGAIYDALVKNNADLIVAPRYTTTKKGEVCLFGFCMHSKHQIIVSGYKGNIVNYRNISEEARKEAAVASLKKPSKQVKKKWFIFF